MLLIPLIVASTAVALTDTTHYVVLNHGRAAGEMAVVFEGSTAMVRYRDVDRGNRTHLETSYRFSPDGALLEIVVREPAGDGGPGTVVERFEAGADSVRWSHSPSRPVRARAGPAGNRGAARADPNGFYRAGSATPFDRAQLARFLLRQPRRASVIWPQRRQARAEIVADTSVSTNDGATRVRLVMVFEGGPTPYGVWLDEHDEFFADPVGWLITVRRGAESSLPALRATETAHRDAQGESLAQRVITPTTGTLVIRNGNVFDSERAVVLPRTSVLVHGERIIAVGPADSFEIPADATVIDATGKAVIPGLWDMHGHMQLRDQHGDGPAQLAMGVTTSRDMGSDVDIAVSNRDRAAAGLLATPRMILSGFIDGPGVRAGPTEAIANTPDEARGWVGRFDSLGYRQIKLYESVDPDLAGVIAEEARKRGLRVSGHVPEGLRAADVVRLGFDEITHIEFLLMAFLPDSARYFDQRRRPPDLRSTTAVVESAEMTRLIDLLRTNRTVVEPTLNFYHARLGGVVPDSMWDATFGRMVRRLHDAGVTLVAGTDGPPARYLVELQLYERAGIPARQILQIATIGAARVMNDDAEYGSISAGKVADIVIVNGRPADRITDLENVETVIRAGRVHEATALRGEVAGGPQDSPRETAISGKN